MTLPTPPSTLTDRDGAAQFGAYAGPLGPVDFAGLEEVQSRGPLWAATHHKRWVYALITTPHHLIAAAIVHLGYAGTAFLSIVDRRNRAMLYDHTAFTVPHFVQISRRAEEGCDAHLRAPGARFAFTRPTGSSRYQLAIDTSRASVRATLETSEAPLPIVAISPVAGAAINVTTKRVLMPSHGALSVHGECHGFDAAVGAMDYTNGLLARKTSWQWALGMGKTNDGRPVAFNLVAGFNDEHECAVWLDGAVIPVARIRFHFDPKRLLGPWRITSPDRRVSLVFRGDARHEERTRLGLVRSSFVQPMGLFSGRIFLRDHAEANIVDVPGVVENQAVVW